MLLTRTATAITLTATDGTLSGRSNPFAVLPGADQHLTITPQPLPTQTVGQPFTLTVQLEDAWGNLITAHNLITFTDTTGTVRPIHLLPIGNV